VFVVLWTLANVFAERFGWTQFDPPPFIWLQGIVGLSGLIVRLLRFILLSARIPEHQRLVGVIVRTGQHDLFPGHALVIDDDQRFLVHIRL